MNFEDEITVYNKPYEMKWEAEFIPAFRGDGYNRANDAGYELDVASIRHSLFGTWHELPPVTQESFEEMVAEMNRLMEKTLESEPCE